MKLYQQKSSQKLNISKNDAWNFFSNPANLSKITPPWLSFQVTSSLPDKMYAGLIITYLVRPLLNIPQTWVTEITQVSEPNYFVDEQRFGPYKMWHHQHIFSQAEDGGVLMEDIVSYVIPFGFLGRIMNALIISKKINEIFNYRRKVLVKMFG
ncbi:MAG: SRPBCC family protein [Ignavibacteriaceae bacterium]|jgi:ligand-binding SRPBCC domain-containing protein|nr:SRPBCC family protein [Ignavibacterium sp.]MCC6254041.1 SRPBCC family protein [Ignavibacteriaceae bacterium]HMN22908.1 SRPBCC family protein [Ignavibacteriaceae bacterium]HRN27896.1 SRPBCC family protein [Ignavibacteriaceae bacterium]HRP92240.1 SRPBCC family protein [Ignavibacteriaceae bacterium]